MVKWPFGGHDQLSRKRSLGMKSKFQNHTKCSVTINKEQLKKVLAVSMVAFQVILK